MRISNAPPMLTSSDPSLERSPLRSSSQLASPLIDTEKIEGQKNQSLTKKATEPVSPSPLTKQETEKSPRGVASPESSALALSESLRASAVEAKKVLPAVQVLTDQFERRDLEMRLYELERTVKGVQHAGHVIFEQSTSAQGGSHAVDRESSHEKDNPVARLQALIQAIQEKEQNAAESPLSPAGKAGTKDAENGAEKDTWDLRRTTLDNDAISKTDAANNRENPENKTAADTALVRLENILLAVPPVIQQANLLGFVDPKYPAGESGVIDILV